MASLSSGSNVSTGRRGVVGLPRPRAAAASGEIAIARGGRGTANRQEIARADASRRGDPFAIDGVIDLEANQNQNLSNSLERYIERVANVQNDPNFREALARDNAGDMIANDAEEGEEVYGPPQNDDVPNEAELSQNHDAPRPSAAAAPRGRSQWAGNTRRLNCMSRALLTGPHNFEVAAQSSQRPAELEALRNMKRSPGIPLAWDNLKHAGKTLILGKVSVELSADPAFLEASGGATISTELLRQKMNHFMALAVGSFPSENHPIEPSTIVHTIV
jgi:hypothetical protein